MTADVVIGVIEAPHLTETEKTAPRDASQKESSKFIILTTPITGDANRRSASTSRKPGNAATGVKGGDAENGEKDLADKTEQERRGWSSGQRKIDAQNPQSQLPTPFV